MGYSKLCARALSARFLVAVIALTLGACDGGGGGDDGGASATDGGQTGGNLPPTPTASAGEVVVNVRDGATDTTLRCGNGTGTLQATLGPVGASGDTMLTLLCSDGMVSSTGFQVGLQVIRSTIAAGDYPLASTHLSPPERDQFGVIVSEGGTGFAAGNTASNAMEYTGTLHMDEAGIGSGSRVRGWFTISWPKVGTVTNGVVNGGAERAGGLAVAFDVTQ